MSLINREQLLAHFAWWPDTDENKGVFQAIIARQPDVDAVEVVRCKDCKHFEPFRGKDGFCKIDGMLWQITHYCACGVRKDGAE